MDAHVPPRLINSHRPSVGLLIGTFGSVPYVHLHLESRRRWYPDVPALVHDDASPHADALRALCARYGAEFRTTPERRGHYNGDLAAFRCGFEWAEGHGLELLVKMSRRFLPLVDWVPELQTLAWATQYATYTNRNGDGFGFRTECIALHVPSWATSGVVAGLTEQGLRESGIFEAFFHSYARAIHENACTFNREYERTHQKPWNFAAYGDWGFMGDSLDRKRPQYLWRASADAVDYCRAAWQYGLHCYRPDDFAQVD